MVNKTQSPKSEYDELFQNDEWFSQGNQTDLDSVGEGRNLDDHYDRNENRKKIKVDFDRQMSPPMKSADKKIEMSSEYLKESKMSMYENNNPCKIGVQIIKQPRVSALLR